jgi:exopolysaccharide production protein ExoZ
MLYNLHVLRVVAALGVVYFHLTSEAGLDLDANIGSRGVDVFFVISGFIIAYIGSSKPDQFFVRRVIRVVPFYWAATLFVFAIVLVFPNVLRTTRPDWVHLGYSLLFIPHETAYGGDVPTLVLGWSLNFEMLFYVCFALSLRISPRWSPLVCAGFILGIVLAVHSFATTSTILSFYGRPIVLEFIYGIGVFYIFKACLPHVDQLARLGALKLGLAVVLVAAFVVLCLGEYHGGWGLPRHVIAGVPSFFIVLSALLLEKFYGITTKNKLIYLLGEASYIVYLVHPYIIYTVLRVVVRHHAVPTFAIAPLIVTLLALTSAISVMIHLWFEKPVMAYLRKRITD